MSSEYIRLINIFCEHGGLQKILDTLETSEVTEKANGFNLSILAILLSLVSLPAQIYHRDVLAEFGPRLITAGKSRLLSIPDRALRDVRREAIEAILKAVDTLNKGNDKEKDSEVLRLQVAHLCLKS